MTTPSIIKITPNVECFSITWTITNKCNYDCMYCPDFLHAGDHVYSLSDMQSYWIDIFNKTHHKNLKYKISFTGGEVTINKDFLPFVEWLRKNYKNHIQMILLTTNGSASVNYYTKLFKSINNISFSFHGEHANEKLFFDKMIKLRKIIAHKNFMHVNIMDEYWIKDRIPLYTQILEKNHISHSVNMINYNIGTRVVPILKGKTNLEI
jgi:MoaA/NifB/PqqE/SkfB family radical SAM enzyme